MSQAFLCLAQISLHLPSDANTVYEFYTEFCQQLQI